MKVQKGRNEQSVLGTQEAMLGVFKLKAGVGDWPGEDKVAGRGKGRHRFSKVDGLWGWSE